MTEQLQEQELKTQALTVVDRAKSITIVDQASYDAACSLLVDEIKPFRARWKDYWENVKKPAYAAYKAILDKFNEGDKPLEAAESAIKKEILRFENEQKRLAEERQRQAQREAEEAARREQDQQAEYAAMAGVSEEEVEQITQAPVLVVAPPVEPAFDRASGVSTRSNWKARVTDLKKLCAAIGKGQVPVTYVLPNQQALDARAKADKSTMNVPGVVPWDDKTVAGRTR